MGADALPNADCDFFPYLHSFAYHQRSAHPPTNAYSHPHAGAVAFPRAQRDAYPSPLTQYDRNSNAHAHQRAHGDL